MILRIFRVTVVPDRVEEFRRFFLEKAVPLMRSTDGVEQVLFGLPRPESPNDFAVVMVWRDLAALEAFVGGDWRVPHIDPDELGVVETRALDHYELVA
ncbi:antibiotic biosynthesis monooxygenase family protein [Ovoidimarina sediminis]|uniref:antibiotic biosynthesis monooxygenase family protein n=1 Tax=Ovoidimarina sediminis TaxID=3079856 RepID=UPI002910E3E1|nr:antibiotic biosynthesis monooxygenase [Rhodophyticola sp. MJ-SS7]MDU8945678.1 antibiotic biosynthesis monooxygenase [Rhodophyticola sp. MJ-SS7]